MTPKEKLKLIEEKIQKLNSNVLKYKEWKISYINRGANDYCLTIVLKEKELFSGKFNTYDSVLSALDLLSFMFDRALNEMKEKEV